MKHVYIKDILNSKERSGVDLQCFIKSIRVHSNRLFLDFVDSTGQIQGVASEEKLVQKYKKITPDSCIKLEGFIVINNNKIEIDVKNIEVINPSRISLSPAARSDFDILDERYTDIVLKKRHLYLRNPKLIAIQKFRNMLLHYIRAWFLENDYVEVAAPIITPLTLYEKSTAIPLKLRGQDLFLSQCAGYYLEAACVALEKVYNISPGFRGEEGKSKRHLLEYWHIKAEIAFAGFEDVFNIVEDLLKYVTARLAENQTIVRLLEENGLQLTKDALDAPFKRLPYDDAIALLKQNNVRIAHGSSISTKHEKILSELTGGGPFWITRPPRTIEPFPYRIDKNPAATMVADLIASKGFGEILGAAEKIYEAPELKTRMEEKGVYDDPRFDWVKEVHESGCPPHVAFGIGVERLIRWLLKLPHVRDAIPFPRAFGRKTVV